MSICRKIATGMSGISIIRRPFRDFNGGLSVSGTPRPARFSTELNESSDKDLPSQLSVLKDTGLLFIEQKKITNMGSGYGRLVDYNLQTKDGSVLFVIEHFYGPSSPHFFVKIKKNIEQQKPIVHMTLIRDTHNNINGMTYFVPPNKIIGTLLPISDDKKSAGHIYAMKSASGEVTAQLFADGSHGVANKVRLLSVEGKIIGKLTKIKQQMIRSQLDAELQYPPGTDLLLKVKLIGAVIFLMGHNGQNP